MEAARASNAWFVQMLLAALSRRMSCSRARIVMTKYHATNAAVRVVEQAMTIVGAPGIFRRHPMQRYYRDVRPGPFHPMTNDVALELIGKTALGIPMEFTPRWG